MPELHERVYAWLCKKSKGSATGKLRCSGILDKLRTDVLNDPVALRKALIQLRGEQLIDYAAGQHGEPISGFLTVVRPDQEVPSHVEAWRAVLADSTLPERDKLALQAIGSAMEGFSSKNMAMLLDGLIRLRENQAQHFGEQVFSVSAMYLMGSSKLLSSLDWKALYSFGIEIARFLPRPVYVVVGGNVEAPTAVVLVENPVSFEAAVDSVAARDCLFVCTFGFGLSASTNDYGNQLAGAVEAGQARVLSRSAGGEVPTLRDILRHQRIQFWGDLDVAGMQIFCRLASKVPDMTLSALYEPMIEAIRHDASRHPYVSAVCKDGQGRMIVQTARSDVQELLCLCEHFAVDQEFVSADDIVRLAGKPLSCYG
ncbi:hypothetical protein I5F36_14455 [Pseudomonas aeruginosa]|nr:hypothetical protein [Pseudomonas aeruginosa]